MTMNEDGGKMNYQIRESRRTGHGELFVTVDGRDTAVEWRSGWSLSAQCGGAAFAQTAVATAYAAGLRVAEIPRLRLVGGPATGGMRWQSHGVIPVCLATRRELVNVLGRAEITVSARVEAAAEILSRPRDEAADRRDEARRQRDGQSLSGASSSIDAATRTGSWVTCAESAQRAVAQTDVAAAHRFLGPQVPVMVETSSEGWYRVVVGGHSASGVADRDGWIKHLSPSGPVTPTVPGRMPPPGDPRGWQPGGGEHRRVYVGALWTVAVRHLAAAEIAAIERLTAERGEPDPRERRATWRASEWERLASQ